MEHPFTQGLFGKMPVVLVDHVADAPPRQTKLDGDGGFTPACLVETEDFKDLIVSEHGTPPVVGRGIDRGGAQRRRIVQEARRRSVLAGLRA